LQIYGIGMYNQFCSGILSLLASCSVVLSFVRPCLTQVIPDTTLPIASKVDVSENTLIITNGTQRGGNLFHSFQDFSLQSGQTAQFKNASGVANIITRITGGKISDIDGTIEVRGTANLFFLNPNGVVFGKNAQLNLGGSFIATTASSIEFADKTQFGVTTATPPTLTISTPTGLQFGNQAQTIVNRSVFGKILGVTNSTVGLESPPNQTIALVGGDVQIEGGHISALAGRIEIASVGENSLVSLISLGQGWQLGYENVLSYRDITISEDAQVEASGKDGTIHLQGRKIDLNSGGQLVNINVGGESTGLITLNGSESVHLVGEGSEQLTSGVLTSVQPRLTGDSGDLIINTPQLVLENGGSLDVGTLGNGQGGDLIVNASESVSIIGVGQSAPSYISSSAVGDESNPITGSGGKLIINTQRLTVADGGLIVAVAASTKGQGGTIVINASESVHVFGQGKSRVGLLPSQIITSSGFASFGSPGGTAEAGDVEINTPQLTVENLALISAGSFKSQSAAGNLRIQANTIVLDHGGKLTTESTSVTGGNIIINATDSVSLYNNGLITAEAMGAGGSGDGGNINLTTPFIFAVPNQNSDIKANAGEGNGGNVTINASGLFGIEPRPQSTPLSDITASSKTGLSGVISINGAEVDPQSGLVNQDTDVVDTKNLITQTCGRGGEFASGEFTITGRSGLPIDPNQITGIPQGLPDFGTPTPTEANLTSTKPPRKALPIVEAQGWMVNQVGEIVLVATAEPGNPLIPTSCPP